MSFRISTTLAAAATAFAIAAPAHAGERPIEIGGGAGMVGSWLASKPFTGGDLRVSIPANEDGDVELLVALQAPQANDRFGIYGIQYKQRLYFSDDSRVQPFLTFGAMGVFASNRRHSVFTFPFLGVLGAGIERRVARRLSVRVDTQVIAALVVPVGVRLAGGVSIPIGRLPAGGSR